MEEEEETRWVTFLFASLHQEMAMQTVWSSVGSLSEDSQSALGYGFFVYLLRAAYRQEKATVFFDSFYLLLMNYVAGFCPRE